MIIESKLNTEPRLLKPEGTELDPKDLAAGRYGTYETVQIWGAEQTMDLQLLVQGQASKTLSKLHPDIVPPEHAEEIYSKANLKHVNPERVRELEAKTGHDIIAVNTALEEQLSPEARVHVNKLKTSGDTTQPTRALQIKSSLEVMAESVENLRDIVLERAEEWIELPHMDTSHLYDALPTVAGRPFAHYGEMLQSGLDLLKFAYNHSIKGKWGDATGNHHSANAMGVDGIALEEKYCEDLKIGHMIAPAQIPGLEFEADVFFVLARLGETMNNIARYVALGKSDDVGIFVDTNPKKRKGSSGMPHKDAKGGNPTAEEQVMSLRNYLMGNMVTGLANCQMAYSRDLSASANARINFDDGFKFFDHCVRRLAGAVYWLGINDDRAEDRVERTFGIVTSNRVMACLTDPRKISSPMGRREAHDLMGELATRAYERRMSFVQVLLQDNRVTSRVDERELDKMTDPIEYVGESKRIIKHVKALYHGTKTLL